MTDGQLFFLVIAAAGVLTLGYFFGRRKNLKLAQSIGRELEGVLHPRDQTYTWLGGVLGFKAEYRGIEWAPRVEATLTLLPRHSLLYLPVALLVTGGDRLFVVARPTKAISGEAHVIATSYRRRLGRLPGEHGWHREAVEARGERFEVLAEDRKTAAGLREWLQSLAQPRRVKHIALTPKMGTLYLYLVPIPGEIRPILDSILAWFRNRG